MKKLLGVFRKRENVQEYGRSPVYVTVGGHSAEVRNGRWCSATPGFAELCRALDYCKGVDDAFRALVVARQLSRVSTRMGSLKD